MPTSTTPPPHPSLVNDDPHFLATIAGRSPPPANARFLFSPLPDHQNVYWATSAERYATLEWLKRFFFLLHNWAVVSHTKIPTPRKFAHVELLLILLFFFFSKRRSTLDVAFIRQNSYRYNTRTDFHGKLKIILLWKIILFSFPFISCKCSFKPYVWAANVQCMRPDVNDKLFARLVR